MEFHGIGVNRQTFLKNFDRFVIPAFVVQLVCAFVVLFGAQELAGHVGRILRALTGSTESSKTRSRARNPGGDTIPSIRTRSDDEKLALGAHCRCYLRGDASVRFQKGE